MNENSNFKVRADFYNGYTRKTPANLHTKETSVDLSEIIASYSSISDKPHYLNVTTHAGMEEAAWMPCVSFEFTGNEYTNDEVIGGIKINEGFNCKFKTDTIFLDNAGYDGCIGFAWTNRSLYADAVPLYAYGANYITETITENYNSNYGLLGNALNASGTKGLTLSLYPDSKYEYSDGGINYARKVSHYVLSYRKGNGSIDYIEGSLPEGIDVTKTSTISVYHIVDKYVFYINGRYFAGISDTLVDVDTWGENEGFFTASVIASPYLEANLEINDINTNGGDYLMNEHIKNNGIHLTQSEKLNLENLGVSILNYYTENEEDEEKDYTEAFRTALANNRRVYVPGGTYKITGELVVRDNCALELAQDAVLEFDPKYFKVTINRETDTITRYEGTPMNVTNVDDDPETFRCITLKMSSRLVGNRATIRVPYNFKGSVIYASTRSHPDSGTYDDDVLPFERYDPQWKPARYVKDINIVKPIETGRKIIIPKEDDEDEEIRIGGLHASVDRECNGTAVFIEGHRNGEEGCSSHLWGLEFTGLRIAGAFEYGIYGTNNFIYVDANGNYVEDPNGVAGVKEKWAWTNDMKINGIIDGCKTGVYLNHCNHAYISTIIQPRPAYDTTTGKANLPYALNGIYLKNCVNANLIGSRVWDWTNKNSLLDNDIKNQHIRLDGECYGLILDDFYYNEVDDDIRNLIYTDTPGNFDTMSILQEPVTKYFRKSEEGKPIFNNGDSSKELVLKDDFDECLNIEHTYYYEDNILLDSKCDEGEVLNEYGCVENMMISSSPEIGKSEDEDYITTGYIKCAPGTTLYLKGLDLRKDPSHSPNKIIYYYSSSEELKNIYKASYYNQNNMVAATDYIFYQSYDNNISSITIPNKPHLSDLKYIRICCHKDDANAPIVSTKKITYVKARITDDVYIKDKFVEKQTTINTDSTDDQIPSAKAVYDLLGTALGEYVTDIANIVGGDA